MNWVESMLNTVELGPRLYTPAPDFTACDHAQKPWNLTRLMGEHGLLLGFVGDIWQAASIRRIIWLQRHASTFIRGGFNVALLIQDKPFMVNGFYISSLTPPEFPLLADADGQVHLLYGMTRHSGLVLVDRMGVIRHKWLMPDERVWPKIHDMLDVLHTV
jgi:peroxiredoxin